MRMALLKPFSLHTGDITMPLQVTIEKIGVKKPKADKVVSS